MNHLIDINGETTERTILVGTILPGLTRWQIEDELDELELLTLTAGGVVVDRVIQERKRIDPAYFIGQGKAEILKNIAEEKNIDTFIFDDDLSPGQVKNLEKTTDKKIIDRSDLILDIFAKRARTKEAKIQVELAQLKHLLPRLAGQSNYLSRQAGGIGTKGPGEMKLETDRRRIRKRISHLQEELQRIEQHRTIRRNSRREIFKIALIGYTNVGKSTLFNLLSESDVLVENKLFATLDPTIRRIELDDGKTILITDTVGFIRKLPHQLVASFRSTLEESMDADILLHVVDLSHPQFEEQIETVKKVIEDIGIHNKPVLMIFNKIDKVKETALISRMKNKYTDSIFISAERGIYIDKLKKEISKRLEDSYIEQEIYLPQESGKLISIVHSLGEILEKEYSNSKVRIKLKTNRENMDKIKRLVDLMKD
jgi:GTP-binding protein HflX